MARTAIVTGVFCTVLVISFAGVGGRLVTVMLTGKELITLVPS